MNTMNKITMNRNISSILAGILLISVSCSTRQKDPAAKDAEVLPDNIVELSADQFKVAGVQFGVIEPKNLSNTLKVNGLITVSPKDLASVCAPLGGFVKSTDFVQGSPVKKGQTLAVMENPGFIELQQNFLESRSRLEYAEGEFDRHKELFENDIYSAKNLQEVTANYKSLKAQVTAVGQKLSLIGIKASDLKEDNISSVVSVPSPISGYIKSVNVNIGKFVDPQDVMFEIVNTSNLTIELTLFEKDISKVAIGQKLSFSLSSESSGKYSAIITQVGKSISADRTVKVYASVNQSTDKILPGMYVNALIETNTNPVAALPEESIVQFDEKEYIFVFEQEKKENGKPFTEFRMIEVKKGITDNGFTEVILPEGFDPKTARVVIKGAYNLMAAKKNAGEMAC
jgi:cobalt-zinc-cadmium efflux system membrane fusion protein